MRRFVIVLACVASLLPPVGIGAGVYWLSQQVHQVQTTGR